MSGFYIDCGDVGDHFHAAGLQMVFDALADVAPPEHRFELKLIAMRMHRGPFPNRGIEVSKELATLLIPHVEDYIAEQEAIYNNSDADWGGPGPYGARNILRVFKACHEHPSPITITSDC